MRHDHWLTDLLRDMKLFIEDAQLVHVEAMAAGTDERLGATPAGASWTAMLGPNLRLVATQGPKVRWN